MVAGHRVGATGRFVVVIAATGVLHHPHVAHFEGIETFAGASFHSRPVGPFGAPRRTTPWGVIGTGSTAVQITSALAERVERYNLFQRTAPVGLPGEMRRYTPEEQERFRRDPAALEALAAQLNPACSRRSRPQCVDVDNPYLARIQQRCWSTWTRSVTPVLRAKLTPHYRAACKRLIFSGDFLRGRGQRPNVDVVVTASIETCRAPVVCAPRTDGCTSSTAGAGDGLPARPVRAAR